jgi:hypothetical protein
MTKYVTPENQKLLWNVINKNPLINDFFLNDHYKKEDWFKSIIQMFYDQNKGRPLNRTDLLMLNKTTILYMVKNIQPSPVINEIQSDQNFLKPYSITENKVDKIGNQFNEKQVEYNSLFDRKIPESPEFSEKQDKPLSNMDELIQQHLREREEELIKYTPLPLVTPPNQESQLPIQSNKLKIEPTQDKINIQIEEINDEDSSDKLIKTVSWSDTVNAEKLENQQKELNTLRNTVDELVNYVKTLEEKINIFTEKK